MEPAGPAQGLQAQFEHELAADRALRLRVDLGAWCVALATIATLLVLIMALDRTSPWLAALSMYAIFTRVSTLVSWKAFLFPRFLLRLDDGDVAVAAAARAVFERHRASLLRPILAELVKPSDPASVAAVTYQDAAQFARDYDIEGHRSFGRRWFLGWCLLSVVLWTTLLFTRGGSSSY